MSNTQKTEFASPEEWQRYRELMQIAKDTKMPTSERAWANAEADRLSTIIARRAIAWLNGTEPSAV